MFVGSLTFHPPLGLAESAALALLVFAAGLWLAWRALRGAGSRKSIALLGLRAAGLALLALIWLNPGHWRDELISQRRDWIVLLDRSASMKVEQAEKETRWEAALRFVEK